MEKKVFCAMEGRNKCIKFKSHSDISDLEIIQRKIREICQRDVSLKLKTENKTIIIQKKDIDGNIWCDIEQDDIVEDKDKLSVVFLSPHKPTYNSSLIHDDDLSTIKVLYTEPINEILPDIPSDVIPTANEPAGSVIDVPSIITEDESIISGSNDENSKSNRMPASCGSVQCSTNSLSSEPNFSSLPVSFFEAGPGSITMPATLPPLTFDLQNKLNELGVLKTQAKLMYHWGTYLWQMTSGQPSKRDYQNLATSIVQAYPLLRGGQSENSIVRSQLSTWIRNHRIILKKQQTQTGQKRNAQGEIIKPATSLAALMPSETSESPKLDISRALVELEKKNGKDENTPHVKRLLKLTFDERRLWIKNEAKSIIDVVTKYPHLKYCEPILNDFYQLKNTTSETIEQNITEMFTRLKIFFDVDQEKTNFECTILIQLLDSLTKRLKKDAKPLFTLKEARSSTDCLMADDAESPRAVIYTENEEIISDAFIVADNNVRVTIEHPTTSKVVACLLAVYYVWDTAYPKPYLNVLQYIENQVLGTCIKNNNVVYKFIRKRDEAVA